MEWPRKVLPISATLSGPGPFRCARPLNHSGGSWQCLGNLSHEGAPSLSFKGKVATAIFAIEGAGVRLGYCKATGDPLVSPISHPTSTLKGEERCELPDSLIGIRVGYLHGIQRASIRGTKKPFAGDIRKDPLR